MAIGFPWILSSESSDINGLCGIFRERFFLSPVLSRGAGAGFFEAIRKGRIVHDASLLQFLMSAINCRPPRRFASPHDGVALRRRNPRRSAPVRRKTDARDAEEHHRPSRYFRHAIANGPSPRRSVDKALDLIKWVSSQDT
jgi:hypothetical protein